MAKKEFILSECIVDDPRSLHVGYIHKGWVKEFIRLLKDCKTWVKIEGSDKDCLLIPREFLDKLVGNKLTNTERREE